MSVDSKMTVEEKYTTNHTEKVVPVENEQADVWGDIEGGGPNYRGLGWIRASVLLVKVQIGLGVLAIPSVLHTLGLVPGILVIIAVAISTTWTDYIVGQFKLRHPEVYTLADVGFLIWGPVGREILGGAYWLYLTFVAGGGLLGISTAFNAFTDHATCTVVFVIVGVVCTFLISSIQTLDRISWIGWIGVGGIMAAVITLAIAVSLQDRPSAAPPTGPWDPQVRNFGNPTFIEGTSAVANVIFSFAGAPNFFNIIAEMRDHKDYTKSLLTCQSFVTMSYLIIGSIVYHYCGIYVASPALGSAGPMLKKITYGLALPGLIVGCVLNTHLPAKYVFVRVLRGSKHLTKNTPTHFFVWFGCILSNCIISFIVAESIPIFGDLISLIGALFATPLALCIECWMYIWDTRREDHPERHTRKVKILQAVSAVLGLVSLYCMIAGIYAAIMGINNSLKEGATTKPFSCADNS